MSLISQLSAFTREELKNFTALEENQFLIVSTLESEPNEIISVFLKHKLILPFFLKAIEDHKLIRTYLEHCIESDFTPSLETIEKYVKEQGSDYFLAKVIKSFLTLPYSMSFLMTLINLELDYAVNALILSKPEFQKTEVYLLILKAGLISQALAEKMALDEEVVSFILKDLRNYEGPSINYPSILINHLILRGEKLDFEKVLSLKIELSLEVYERVLKNVKKSKHLSKIKVQWTPNIEKINFDFFDYVSLMDVPPESKFRKQFIREHPEQADFDEIFELIQNNLASGRLLKRAIKFSLVEVKQIPLDLFEEHLSPSTLADAVRATSSEKLIYFYNNLSSKFKPAFQKVMTNEEMKQVDTSRKKSYFIEAFQFLSKGNLAEFRGALSHGYDLFKFSEDSNQKSKKDACMNVRVREDFFLNLTKEEVLLLAKTPIGFPYFNEGKSPWVFSVEEIEPLIEKLDVKFAFQNVNDQVGLISSNLLGEERLAELFDSARDEILQQGELLKCFISKVKTLKRIKIDNEESIFYIASNLSLIEFKKIVKIAEYCWVDCLLIKSKDQEYVISTDEILEKISQREILENERVITDLIIRDKNLATRVVDAYLNGNKGLSLLLNKPVKITRQKIKFFEEMRSFLGIDTENIVNEFFVERKYLEDLKEKLPNSWKQALRKYARPCEIKIGTMEVRELNRLAAELSNCKFLVDELIFTGHGRYSLGDKAKVKRINLAFNEDVISKEEILLTLNSLSEINADEVVLMEQNSLPTKLQFIIIGSDLITDPQQVINDACSDWEFILESTFEQFSFLAERGLVFSNELIQYLVEKSSNNQYYYSDTENQQLQIKKFNLIISRRGSLDGFLFDEESINSIEIKNLIIKAGAKVLDPQSLLIKKIETELIEQGRDFSPKDVSELSVSERKSLINFIKTTIDPRYGEIDFNNVNLSELTIITSYSEMKAFLSLDGEDLAKLFLMPLSLINNKKILKSLKDFTSFNTDVITKVYYIKRIMECVNAKTVLDYSDFIVIDGSKEILQTEVIANISLEVLLSFINHLSELKSQSIILKDQDKGDILRFLRTASSHSESYISDILDYIKRILSALDGVEARILVLSEDKESNADLILELENSISGIREKLEEISMMNDAVHMHDRLVKLAAFIKTQPNQPLQQDKFHRLEKSQEVIDEFGYAVYFPKVRGDLKTLGDKHGWCVNTSSSYGDGVIEKGNVLVGICEKNTESSIDNVIALAHYLRNKNGTFQLEQLKWSRLKKGSNNVDATYNFKHQILNNLIVKELEKKKV